MVRKLTACALAVSSFMVAGQLLAQGTFTMKIGAEFRSEYEYNNDGLNEDAPGGENATSTISLAALKLKLYGNIGQSTTFNFLLNAYPAAVNTQPAGSQLIEVAYLTHSFSDMFALRVGKSYLNFGGFERKRQDYKAIYLSPAVTGAVNVLAAPAIEAHITLGDAGKVVVQAATDKRGANAENKQPSVYLEYAGDFSGIKALAQYGMFDKGAGMSWGLGVGMTMMNADISLDFNMQEDAAEAAATNVVLHAGYDVGAYTPWVTINHWDVEQDGTDAEGNTTPAFEDNLLGWAVGVTCSDDAQAWHPYVAVVGRGGDFGPNGATESYSDLAFKVGVNADF